jgi:hypothetical protein
MTVRFIALLDMFIILGFEDQIACNIQANQNKNFVDVHFAHKSFSFNLYSEQIYWEIMTKV